MKSLNTSKFIKNFGFTVLEIVIAISVIGILAVIVTVSYSGITNRATESTIKSDLSNALGDFNLYKTEKNKYPTAVDDCPNVDPNKVCIEFSGDNQYEYLVDDATNPASYRLIVTNKDLAYYIEDDFNSPKLLDASVPEFNPIPTAPITYTLTLTAGTGGTVSGGGTFDAGTVRTITATPSTYYSFSSWTGSTGCSGTASHTITMDANKSCTANFTPTAIATPTMSTVTQSSTSTTTTWSWSAVSCPGNSVRYQYRYTNSTGYDSGLVGTTNTSVTFTTSTQDVTYTVAVQAQCYNPVTSSSWSTAKSASYYRPSAGGTVTYNSGSGSWTAPAGVTSVTAYVWGAGGSGSGTACSNQSGAGGGAFATKTISVTAGSSYSYFVGAPSSGSAGGDSWFINSSTVRAKGGGASPPDDSAGIGGQASACIPTTGAYSGGNGGGGDHASEYGGGGGGGAGSGGNGGTGGTAYGGGGSGGSGGIGTYPGGRGGTGSSPLDPGQSPGGGGGGADTYDCGNGGLGGSGRIILVW